MCIERGFKIQAGVYDINNVTLINYFWELTEWLSFYTKKKTRIKILYNIIKYIIRRIIATTIIKHTSIVTID